MSEQHSARNGRAPTMNVNDSGGWIRPKPPHPTKRRRWLAPALALSVLVLIGTGSCSSFAAGVRDGYASATTTTVAAPTTTPRPVTPATTSAAVLVTTGARVGATVGYTPAPSSTTEAPVALPDYLPDDDTAPNVDVDVYYHSCKEAKAAGAAPIHAGEPGYRLRLDRDGDGTACDK